MDTRALALAAIMLCLAGPIAIGFIMPNDYEEGTGYTIGNPINITASLENDTQEISVRNTSYVNNLFLWYQDLYGYNHWQPSGDSTTVYNNYPLLDTPTSSTFAITPGQILDLTSIYSGSTYEMIELEIYNDNFTDPEGTQYQYVIYYPDTKIAYGYQTYYQYKQIAPNTIGTTITTNKNVTQYFYEQMEDANNNKLYIDATKGFEYDPVANGSNGYWHNGFVNEKVAMIIQPTNDMRLMFRINNVNTYMYIKIQAGYWYLGYDVGGTPTYFDTPLGEKDTYDKLLVEVDGSTGVATVTGLAGMDNFTDDYTIYEGNYMLVPMGTGYIDAASFRGMGNHDPMRYYVPYTYSINDKTRVMNNVTVDFNKYYPKKLWSMELSNIAYFGDYITVYVTHANNTTESTSYNVTDGKIRVVYTQDGDPQLVPLSGLNIALIPDSEDNTKNHLYVGGKIDQTIPLVSTDTVTIEFGGVWKMIVKVSLVEPYDYNNYLWMPGTFNLTATGYCTVGLLVSSFMAILCGVYAFRMDQSGWFGVIPSAVCAVIYLLLLFSYA